MSDSGAREAILARVRTAISGSEAASVPRLYRQAGQLAPEARVELFCERAGDYRSDVRRVPAAGLQAAITEAFAGRHATRIAVPAGLPASWRPGLASGASHELELVEDEDLSPADLDRLDGVLTGSTLAIAETGTIVLSCGPGEGRRALTLVPDLHVCVVEESRIVEQVPEAMGLLAEIVRTERRALTFISGPSATSDIELSRVEGVHGPRSLVVLVSST